MTHQYQVGQEVVCYRPGENYKTGEKSRGGAGWEDGKKFTIKKISDVDRDESHGLTIQILWPENDGPGIYNLWCQPIIEIPEHLFKL